MQENICPICSGARLKKEALGVVIDKKSIHDICSLSINMALGWVKRLKDEENVLNTREKNTYQILVFV